MFGITFVGHPNLTHIYLPAEFQGNPLRKDFPLLARRIRPWPGIVDVEPMPGLRRVRGGRRMTATSDRETARLPGRQGGRRPGQPRARDRGHGPQHGAPAPGHPRHPAHRGQARRRAGRLGRAGLRLHAPGLREAHRGPHLPAGHHPDQPHRLAGQLRQRGAVHPRRREADGGRGTAPGPVDPHDPLRALPHRQHLAVPRRLRPPARRHDRRLLRLPRPGVRPQPDRGGHRRAVPPELRPHRRPQGRPARRAGSPTPRRRWSGCGPSATRWTIS